VRVRVASVEARSYYGSDEPKNVKLAISYIKDAASKGAQLVCFPEGYPGPNNGPMGGGPGSSTHPMNQIRKAAHEYGVFITAGELEPNPAIPGTYYLSYKLVTPEGEVAANYRRVEQDHPPLNKHLSGGKQHVLPGDDVTVVSTRLGNIGLQICSELFIPEISRIQMLKGADIIVSPGNWLGDLRGAASYYDIPALRDTWHCLARARAAENLVYVIVADCMLGRRDIQPMGFAAVAGPDRMLKVRKNLGVLFVDLDMDRLKWLRSRHDDDEILGSRPKKKSEALGCRPGQNHDRRPALYGKLTEPQKDAFDYFYFKRGLDAWKDEYDKTSKYRTQSAIYRE